MDYDNRHMNCFVCHEICEYLYKHDSLYPPISGTMFESTGNYGSTLWDMEGRKFLQIVICDKCLKEKAKYANVIEWEAETPPPKSLVRKVNFMKFRKEEGYDQQEHNHSLDEQGN